MYMLHENYPRGREKKKKKARGKTDDKLAYGNLNVISTLICNHNCFLSRHDCLWSMFPEWFLSCLCFHWSQISQRDCWYQGHLIPLRGSSPGMGTKWIWRKVRVNIYIIVLRCEGGPSVFTYLKPRPFLLQPFRVQISSTGFPFQSPSCLPVRVCFYPYFRSTFLASSKAAIVSTTIRRHD